MENEEVSPQQVFLNFINQRLAKRQRELDGAIRFSSHYAQIDAAVTELKAVRAKFVSLMRREGGL